MRVNRGMVEVRPFGNGVFFRHPVVSQSSVRKGQDATNSLPKRNCGLTRVIGAGII